MKLCQDFYLGKRNPWELLHLPSWRRVAVRLIGTEPHGAFLRGGVFTERKCTGNELHRSQCLWIFMRSECLDFILMHWLLFCLGIGWFFCSELCCFHVHFIRGWFVSGFRAKVYFFYGPFLAFLLFSLFTLFFDRMGYFPILWFQIQGGFFSLVLISGPGWVSYIYHAFRVKVYLFICYALSARACFSGFKTRMGFFCVCFIIQTKTHVWGSKDNHGC